MQKLDKELRTETLKNLLIKKGGKEQSVPQVEEPVNEGLPPPLRDHPKNNNYPLSSAQKRLFILHKMDPNDTAYNIPLLIRIQGEINVAKLKAAFNLIVSRQDSLRTTFEMDEGHPVQVVHEQVDWELKLSENPFFDPTKDVVKWIKPFDLIHGPLFRAELIKVSSQTSYLCLDMHHIIADARTFSILIEEFSLAYAGFPLAPLKIHYRDYAIWQSQLLSSNKLQDQKSYWMAEYSQTLPVLRLPQDPLPMSPCQSVYCILKTSVDRIGLFAP